MRLQRQRFRAIAEMRSWVEEEKNMLEDKPKVEEKKEKSFKGFAERRSK